MGCGIVYEKQVFAGILKIKIKPAIIFAIYSKFCYSNIYYTRAIYENNKNKIIC